MKKTYIAISSHTAAMLFQGDDVLGYIDKQNHIEIISVPVQ